MSIPELTNEQLKKFEKAVGGPKGLWQRWYDLEEKMRSDIHMISLARGIIQNPICLPKNDVLNSLKSSIGYAEELEQRIESFKTLIKESHKLAMEFTCES